MKQSKHLIQTIRNWYSSHNPSDDAKWCIQNLLGDYYGWGSEEQKEITEIMSPIDDKPECLCSCHKNGYNGTHDESRCLCHKPVREIEPIDLGDPIDPPLDIETIEVKLNQLITSHNQLQKAVNSLKERE